MKIMTQFLSSFLHHILVLVTHSGAFVCSTRLLTMMLRPAVNRQPGFRRGTRRAKQRREEQPRWLASWLASCWLGLAVSGWLGLARDAWLPGWCWLAGWLAAWLAAWLARHVWLRVAGLLAVARLTGLPAGRVTGFMAD